MSTSVLKLTQSQFSSAVDSNSAMMLINRNRQWMSNMVTWKLLHVWWADMKFSPAYCDEDEFMQMHLRQVNTKKHKKHTCLCDLRLLCSYICECSLMKCHELVYATWRVFPVLSHSVLFVFLVATLIPQVTSKLMYLFCSRIRKAQEETEWEGWRGLRWGIV